MSIQIDVAPDNEFTTVSSQGVAEVDARADIARMTLRLTLKGNSNDIIEQLHATRMRLVQELRNAIAVKRLNKFFVPETPPRPRRGGQMVSVSQTMHWEEKADNVPQMIKVVEDRESWTRNTDSGYVVSTSLDPEWDLSEGMREAGRKAAISNARQQAIDMNADLVGPKMNLHYVYGRVDKVEVTKLGDNRGQTFEESFARNVRMAAPQPQADSGGEASNTRPIVRTTAHVTIVMRT